MNSIIYIILLLLICMFLYYINKTNNTVFNIKKFSMPSIQQTMVQKNNCDVETIYSFTDEQCANICQPHGNYVSKRGICVNVLAFQTEQVNNVCDPKSGVLAYLTGNAQFGSIKLRCLTIDDGIQPSDLTKPNILCENGKIDINYLFAYPQLPDCKCKDDEILALVTNTNAVRSRGICVDKKFKDFYDINNLLFDKNSTIG